MAVRGGSLDAPPCAILSQKLLFHDEVLGVTDMPSISFPLWLRKRFPLSDSEWSF